ncbi:MAG: ABC transporter substrate-binding protein [Propionibacteriaceae bacterium]|nr:ABC transporter substrate-binding protein [Propionibacteriaceae bacterium]
MAGRSGWTMLLAGAVLAALLTGCGGSTGETPAPTSASEQAGADLLPAAEGATSYPLTITSPWGSSELKERPKRIAVLRSAHDAEYLSLLGVTPTLATADMADEAWMVDAFPHPIETTVDFSALDGIPYEEIAKAKPDLIVFSSFDLTESYDKLKAIAPVVAAPKGDDDISAPWQDRMRHLAKVLDLSDAAEAAIAKVENEFATLRDEHPQLQGRSVNYLVHYGAEYGLILQNRTGESSEHFLDQLGLAHSPVADRAPQEGISNEFIGELDADLLVLSDNTYDDTSGTSEIGEITNLPLYQNLPVVQQGRAVVLTNTLTGFKVGEKETEGNLPWAIARTGPIGQLWAARILAPLLDETLQG